MEREWGGKERRKREESERKAEKKTVYISKENVESRASTFVLL